MPGRLPGRPPLQRPHLRKDLPTSSAGHALPGLGLALRLLQALQVAARPPPALRALRAAAERAAARARRAAGPAGAAAEQAPELRQRSRRLRLHDLLRLAEVAHVVGEVELAAL